MYIANTVGLFVRSKIVTIHLPPTPTRGLGRVRGEKFSVAYSFFCVFFFFPPKHLPRTRPGRPESPSNEWSPDIVVGSK